MPIAPAARTEHRGVFLSPREDAHGEGSGGRTARPGVNRDGAGRPARRAVQYADPRGPRWQPDKRPMCGQCRGAVIAPGGPGTARGGRRKGGGHANMHPPAFRRSSRLRRSCRYPLVVRMEPTDFRTCDHCPPLGRYAWPRVGAIHRQRQRPTPAMGREGAGSIGGRGVVGAAPPSPTRRTRTSGRGSGRT